MHLAAPVGQPIETKTFLSEFLEQSLHPRNLFSDELGILFVEFLQLKLELGMFALCLTDDFEKGNLLLIALVEKLNAGEQDAEFLEFLL